MCYYLNSIYNFGSKIYYKIKIALAKVEELVIELETVHPDITVEEFEIIGPIIIWKLDTEYILS